MKTTLALIFVSLALYSCSQSGTAHETVTNPTLISTDSTSAPEINPSFVHPDSLSYSTIHVFVALCDNENQGIVPVPKAIGNGKDYNQNLYWGCGYGVRTYFKKSDEWNYLGTQKSPNSMVLERVLFKHKTKNVYLLADAYDGMHIKPCTEDFFSALSAKMSSPVYHKNDTLYFGSSSSLCAYIGHNGLMDFDVTNTYSNQDSFQRQAIVLACKSHDYYTDYIRSANAFPLVMTNGFMAPEAYSLEWALKGWVRGETAKQIEERASQAYNHYQKCGIKGARWLMRSGF